MYKRILAMMLSGALLSLGLSFQPVHAQAGPETELATKARTDVSKLGVGKSARVEVKLHNNSKVKGYISDAGEDSFTVVDSKTGAAQTVAYADVTRVKKSGGGLSTKTWISIAAVTAGAIVTWIVIKPVLCDGGAQSRGPC